MKVNKDKANGQKPVGNTDVKTGTASAGQKDVLQNSHKDTVKTDNDNEAGTSGLGSLGMLGDYSSSEDSDH